MHTGICRNTKGGQVGSQLRWTEIQHCKDTFLLFDTILSWFIVFIFSTLLTAPFWFSTVCYRVLRTIEIIHDPIHLGEKNTRVVVVSICVWGQGPMLVTWHVFNEAAAVVKKSLWHLCKSQWRGEKMLTTCSDELPIKDVASLAVGKSTTALMFRVLFMPYLFYSWCLFFRLWLIFGWSLGLSENVGYIPNYSHLIGIMISKTIGFRGLAYFQTYPFVTICHCSSCSSPNNGMTQLRWATWRTWRGPWRSANEPGEAWIGMDCIF